MRNSGLLRLRAAELARDRDHARGGPCSAARRLGTIKHRHLDPAWRSRHPMPRPAEPAR